MSRLRSFLLVLLASLFSSSPLLADAWTTIKERGTLIVGVKADYKPWGYLDENGNIVGMEIDMAHGIARRMGVKLELVPVVASNRMEYLKDGKIDLIIATMSYNLDRAKQVGFIEPFYYASMVGIVTPAGSGIAGTAGSLEGRNLCTIDGAFWNKLVAEDYTRRDLMRFKTVPEAEAALLSGQCEGFIYDDVVLLYKLLSEAGRWDDYDLVQIIDINPVVWGMAVRLEEVDQKFGRFVRSVAEGWHRAGTLLKLEKQWVGQNSMSLIWLTERVKKELAPVQAVAPATRKPAASPQQVRAAVQPKPQPQPAAAAPSPPEEQQPAFNPFKHD